MRSARRPWTLEERMLLVGIAVALVVACGLVGALFVESQQ